MDGVSLLPYELLFTKFTVSLLTSHDTASTVASKYTEWSQVQ